MKDAYDPNTVSPDNSVGLLINRIRMHLANAMDRALAQDKNVGVYELSAAQFSVLSTLYQGGIENAIDLCRVLAYDRGAMSRMLDRLEAKGLIRRVRLHGERRTITLELTPEGQGCGAKDARLRRQCAESLSARDSEVSQPAAVSNLWIANHSACSSGRTLLRYSRSKLASATLA